MNKRKKRVMRKTIQREEKCEKESEKIVRIQSLCEKREEEEIPKVSYLTSHHKPLRKVAHKLSIILIRIKIIVY